MAKQTFYWPNPPVQIDTAGLATEAKQDAQIVIAEDTLTELTDLHADNTAENAAILAEIQDFHADNTAENVALDTSIDAVNTSVGTVNTSVGTVNTSVQAVNTSVQAVETAVDTVNTSVQAVNTSIDDLAAKSAAGLVPEQHDYLALTYVSSGNGQGEIETVTYKLGGAGGTTQAVLTLAYDSNNKLSSVTKA